MDSSAFRLHIVAVPANSCCNREHNGGRSRQNRLKWLLLVIRISVTEFAHEAAPIRDALVVTVIALLDVTAKHGGSAKLDRGHDEALCGRTATHHDVDERPHRSGGTHPVWQKNRNGSKIRELIKPPSARALEPCRRDPWSCGLSRRLDIFVYGA